MLQQAPNTSYDSSLSFSADLASHEEGNQIFWKSESYLQRILPRFKKSPLPIEQRMAKSIKGAIDSFSKPRLLQRTLENLQVSSMNPYHQITLSPLIQELSLFNCHDGQRKLTMSLLEFLSCAMKKLSCKDDDILVVYAGSSGRASAVALDVFPNIKIAMYDPDPNTLSQMPPTIKNSSKYMKVYKQTNQVALNFLDWKPLMVFTGEAGWFTDQTAKYIKDTLFPQSKRKYLLFVSDIREEATEKKIVNDMQSQMRWTLMQKADAYMYKFRLPYTDHGELPQDIKMMYDGLSHLDKTREKDNNDDNTYPVLDPHPINAAIANNPSAILYMDGEMFLQIFGPQRTTELRLIGYRERNLQRKEYRLRYYDAMEVESKMAEFNAVIRPYVLFERKNGEHKDKDRVSSQLWSSSFEKLSEYVIIRSCAEILCIGKLENTLLATIRGLYKKIDGMMGEVAPRKVDADTCKYLSALSSMKKKGGGRLSIHRCISSLREKTPMEFKEVLKKKGIM